MRPIRQALTIGAVATLVASCGTPPQLRAAVDGGTANHAARYRTLQTTETCACTAAFATAEGQGIATATTSYRVVFSVVDQGATDQVRVQVAQTDFARSPVDLTLWGNSEGVVTISGPIVTLTATLIRSAGQDPRALPAVVITLNHTTGVLDLAINGVPTFTGNATTFGIAAGSCTLPPFLPIPEPPEDTL